MTDFVWSIYQIEAMNEASLQNVVVISYFKVSKNENGLLGETQSNVNLLPPDAQHFVQFQDVTEQDVIKWTREALGVQGVAVYEGMVQEQIDAQKVPQPHVVPLPWA